MKKEIVNSKVLPNSVAPYSQVVKYGNLIFISGQVSEDKEGNLVLGDIKTETKMAMTHIKDALEEQGLTMDNVIKATIYLSDEKLFNDMNSVYKTFFTEGYPARICVSGVQLYGGANIEIEVIAGI